MVAFDNRFAADLAEMALPWRAVATPDARLLALNDRLATELGLDPGWLRGPDGVRLLVGTFVRMTPHRWRRLRRASVRRLQPAPGRRPRTIRRPGH